MADTKQLINREDSLLIVIDAQEKLMPAVAEKEKVTAQERPAPEAASFS